jgi:nitroreductase
MTGEALSDEELMPLFEAGRWAPSFANSQSWRFIYAKRDTPSWSTLFGLLVDGNKRWCANAGVLVVMVSKKITDDGKRNITTHSFDAGAAWENLALEGAKRGLVVHGMAGFDYDLAKRELGVPAEYQIEAMCAIGKLAKKETLPEDLQAREVPSDRKPLSEIIMEGTFRQ